MFFKRPILAHVPQDILVHRLMLLTIPASVCLRVLCAQTLRLGNVTLIAVGRANFTGALLIENLLRPAYKLVASLDNIRAFGHRDPLDMI